MDCMIKSMNDILTGLKIDASCINASRHRHVGIYDVKLNPSERVRSLETRTMEIALHLNSKTNPLIKPIPEKGIVRIQTVLDSPDIIPFNDLYSRATSSIGVISGFLPMLIGESYEGNALWLDLAEHPHTLVAGETGSGKSVFLHLLIANVARRHDTKLYLIDPKRVEFTRYMDGDNLVKGVARTYSEAMSLLNRIVDIMETRYSVMENLRVSDIRHKPNLFDKLLIIIDEAADLMFQQDKRTRDFENVLIRLAQKSRAAGIYLVLATQRPSVDVVTGLIKANFPARIAFKVASKSNSRVILDANGAESLVGRGDGILKSSIHNFVRFQSALV